MLAPSLALALVRTFQPAIPDPAPAAAPEPADGSAASEDTPTHAEPAPTATNSAAPSGEPAPTTSTSAAPSGDPPPTFPSPAAPSGDPTPTTSSSAPSREPAPSPAASSPPSGPTASPASTPSKPDPARPRWWGPEPRPKVSGYGGPALHLSGLHGAFAAFVGIEGGLNIVQRVTVGASLLWLLNPVDARAHAIGPANRLNFNYGGLVVDVAYVRRERLAGTIGGLLGGGGACLQDPNNGDCADRLGFFLGEPRAGLRVRLAPVVRLHLAFGWRLVAARTWKGPRALGGPSGSIILEFGWF
ncbi:MAG TPA: hypothetical protein VIK91_11695 [Nannocystis sp.]